VDESSFEAQQELQGWIDSEIQDGDGDMVRVTARVWMATKLCSS